jgi:hypothetical protein
MKCFTAQAWSKWSLACIDAGLVVDMAICLGAAWTAILRPDAQYTWILILVACATFPLTTLCCLPALIGMGIERLLELLWPAFAEAGRRVGNGTLQ